MLAVTTRLPVRVRLEGICTQLGLPAPIFVGLLEEALESGVDRPVLFLDLGSCCKDRELGCLVQTWEAFRPGSEVVLFTPLLDREAELRAAVSLVKSARSVEVRVMTTSDFYRDEAWQSLAAARERAALEAELRRELMEAIRCTGRPLRAEPLVLELLHEAPRYAGMGAIAATPLDEVRVRADAERKRRWKLLRRSGQLPASWLLLVFRLVWYMKLRQEGWSPQRIAAFMGFPSPRHLRLTVRRRFGIRVEELKHVRYEDSLTWAATLLTTSHLRLAGLTVQALITPLLTPPYTAERPQPPRASSS